MRLYELLPDISWEELKESLVKNYKVIDEELNSYQEVFYKLFILEPKENDMKIHINHIIVDLKLKSFYDEDFYEVFGTDGTFLKDTEDAKFITDEEILNREVSYGLDFTPWNEVLGMNIDEETLNNIDLMRADIVCHILYEMTFIGYEEHYIQEVRKGLCDEAEKIKNMSKEEIEKNTISLEDFKKMLLKDDFNDLIDDELKEILEEIRDEEDLDEQN